MASLLIPVSNSRGVVLSRRVQESSIRWRPKSSLLWMRPMRIRTFRICPNPLDLSLRCSADSNVFDVFEDEEIEEFWKSVPKPLLTIGKQGVQSSHCTAFHDLISNHVLVKVKHSFQTTSEEVANAILQNTNAQLLQTKGNILLFLSGDTEAENVRNWVKDQQLKKDEKKVRRELNKQIKKTPPSGVKLPKSVMSLLKSMEEKHLICSITFDTRSKMLLSELSEKDQLELLGSLDRQKLKRVNNKSAWLTSQIKLHQMKIQEEQTV